jgi:probable HAF family extracellular repeat protein
MKGRAALGLLLAAVVLLAAAPAALAALSVTRAELNGGQLRVEGQGATPNATITIDGVAMGTAESDGRFRIERSGFSSPTCRITVSDGASSAQATLSGCTPAGSSPPPPPPPPPPPSSTTASFQGLGQLPGGAASYGYGVSGDGQVVVGQAYTSTWVPRAFRWTAATGMQDLGDLGGGDAVAYDANADGSVVVGRSSDAEGNHFHGFRWTAAGGMQGLPIGEATDVSADGNAAVGFAVLWTAADGVISVGASNNAFGISPEGDVVVGMTAGGTGRGHAMRWTRAGGAQDLGTLGGDEAFADSASSHGAVIVGQSLVRQNPWQFWHAFRWTAARGMEDLKTLGGPQSAAYDVTPDGSVIVGKSLISSSSASERAFRWTAKTGMRDLRRELLDAGITAVEPWTLFSAVSVSTDGRVIVGYGLNASRQWEAFRAVLPVPR